MVYVILGKGFEEIEAITQVDVLRRSGAEVRTAGIGGLQVEGAHGIVVTADCTVEQMDVANADMIVIPGGLGGVEAISGDACAMAAIKKAYEDGKYVAAICAGPSVLAKLGIIEGKNVTSYPGTKDWLGDVVYHEDKPVVVDGKIITSRAPGTSVAFALALSKALCGEETAKQVEKDLVIY